MHNKQEKLIEWEKNYKIGYKRLDEQHYELVRIVNELYYYTNFKDSEDPKLKESFKEALRKTVDYLAFHFSYEERIMLAIKYNKLLEHSSEHKKFAQTIFDCVKSYEVGSLDAIDNLLEYLKEWLMKHVIVSDRQFVEEVKETLQKISE